MVMLRLVLAVGWIAVALFTLQAIRLEGLDAGMVFVTDIAAMNWRGAFNVDFICYVVLFALWVMWRHRFSPLGILCGVLCLGGGTLVVAIYLLIASVVARGDIRALLLGQQAMREVT